MCHNGNGRLRCPVLLPLWKAKVDAILCVLLESTVSCHVTNW